MTSRKNGAIYYTADECKLLLSSFKSLALVIEQHADAVRASEARKIIPVALAPPSPTPPAKPQSPVDASRVNLQLGNREKVDIAIKIVFLKLGKIETIRDKFSAKVLIQTKWREPKLDSRKSKERVEINPADFWNPNLYIVNANNDVKEAITHQAVFSDQGDGYVVERRIANGSFTEFMELNEFPFDSQDLSISICSRRTEEEVCLVEDNSEPCAVNIEMFIDAQEWCLLKCVNTWQSVREDASQSQKTHHSVFTAAAKVSRRCEFFIWNAIIILFMITTLSFLTFVMAVTAPQNRLQLTVILLLNIVNLKSVINQSLPSVAYLTYLDKYLLACGAILLAISIWHAVASSLIQSLGQTIVENLDNYVALSLLAVYFILNFVITFITISSKHMLKSEIKLASETGVNAFDCDFDEKRVPKQFADLTAPNVSDRNAHNQDDQFTQHGTVLA